MLLELERRHLDASYVRTLDGYEVDFITRHPSGRTELIQVCADITERAVWEREIRAMESASQMYPDSIKRILTATRDTLPAAVPPGVIVQPAYEWMLQGED